MRPFQFKDSEHQFKENVHFEQLIQLYSFDRHLRLLAIDAIERIEVSIRAHLSNELYEYAQIYKNNYITPILLLLLILSMVVFTGVQLSSLETQQTRRGISTLLVAAAVRELRQRISLSVSGVLGCFK